MLLHRMEGPPITKQSAAALLLAHNVTVGIGLTPDNAWNARNARFDIGWVRKFGCDGGEMQLILLLASNRGRGTFD